jgi:hypothetical protein
LEVEPFKSQRQAPCDKSDAKARFRSVEQIEFAHKVAQRIAGDADSRTAELYDRREQKICSSRRSEFAIKIDMRSNSGGSEEREISNW